MSGRLQDKIAIVTGSASGIGAATAAGADVFSEPLALADADWERCMALNLRAAWHMARAVLPSMLAQGAGKCRRHPDRRRPLAASPRVMRA